MTTRSTILLILNILSTIVGLILGAKIVFGILGVNQAVPIVNWIENASFVLTAPFRGLFENVVLGSNSIIDLNAIVALFVYSIFFAVLYRIIARVTEPHVIETERSVHAA